MERPYRKNCTLLNLRSLGLKSRRETDSKGQTRLVDAVYFLVATEKGMVLSCKPLSASVSIRASV